MIKLTVLIPTTYNNGDEVQKETFQRLENQLLEIAGGYTIEGVVEGGWVDKDGTIYKDKSKKYSIITDEAKLSKIKETITKIGKELKQKSVYLEVFKTEVNFLEIE
ncbi:MAG: hypothetical protein MI740_10625 [Halanaerobiales bacterium]|nr:hypothetical protein [Halanaerobiales bacterium]